MGHVNEYPSMHNFGNPLADSVNDSISTFDRAFLEISVTNCIVGMLLTYPYINEGCHEFMSISCTTSFYLLVLLL